MAQNQLRSMNSVKFASRLRTTGPTANDSVGTPANYSDMAALDARLQAISGTTYTNAMLEIMSLNDKIYALRLNDDASSI